MAQLDYGMFHYVADNAVNYGYSSLIKSPPNIQPPPKREGPLKPRTRACAGYGHVLLVGCSKKQELSLERVQRRALKIISLGGRRNVPDLPTLRERRELAAVKLLKRMAQP
ncbi:hypothetical protein Bbelb_347330 [Branchiostoma belcheri]|nr:hypothetical protein Bbelb_347330 [Branchiostoma belcheri]